MPVFVFDHWFVQIVCSCVDGKGRTGLTELLTKYPGVRSDQQALYHTAWHVEWVE
jgi:hypothetical protein